MLEVVKGSGKDDSGGSGVVEGVGGVFPHHRFEKEKLSFWLD